MQQERQRRVRRGAGARTGARGVGLPGGRRRDARDDGAVHVGRRSRRQANGDLFAIAAPHVSPQGGWQSYRAAYGMLRPEHKDRTFVILATSHYGEPEKFGLTRKNFRTPLGDAPTDTALVDWLAARGGNGVEMEDYCHSLRAHGGVAGDLPAARARART